MDETKTNISKVYDAAVDALNLVRRREKNPHIPAFVCFNWTKVLMQCSFQILQSFSGLPL